MASPDDKPCDTHFPEGSSELDPLQRRQVLLITMQEVVKGVDMTSKDRRNMELLRGGVNRVHGVTSELARAVDNVHNYVWEVLLLGLLLLEFIDAIREGDGS